MQELISATFIAFNLATIGFTLASLIQYTVTTSHKMARDDARRRNVLVTCFVFLLLIVNMLIGIYIIAKIQTYQQYIPIMIVISLLASVVTISIMKRRQGLVFGIVKFSAIAGFILLIVEIIFLH